MSQDPDLAAQLAASEAARAKAEAERDENEGVFKVWRRRCGEAEGERDAENAKAEEVIEALERDLAAAREALEQCNRLADGEAEWIPEEVQRVATAVLSASTASEYVHGPTLFEVLREHACCWATMTEKQCQCGKRFTADESIDPGAYESHVLAAYRHASLAACRRLVQDREEKVALGMATSAVERVQRAYIADLRAGAEVRREALGRVGIDAALSPSAGRPLLELCEAARRLKALDARTGFRSGQDLAEYYDALADVFAKLEGCK